MLKNIITLFLVTLALLIIVVFLAECVKDKPETIFSNVLLTDKDTQVSKRSPKEGEKLTYLIISIVLTCFNKIFCFD